MCVLIRISHLAVYFELENFRRNRSFRKVPHLYVLYIEEEVVGSLTLNFVSL